MSLTIKLYDLQTNELADISGISLTRTMRRRLNMTRAFVVTAPAADSLLTTVAGDGYPNLRRGNRKLIVWEDGGPGDQPIFHGRIFNCERTGDGTQNLVTITAFDPYMEIGFESNDFAGRPVRDGGGDLVLPRFTASVSNTPDTAISGPDLIQQVLANSVTSEGALPIDFSSGTFDLAVPPAVDLSVVDTMAWPVLVGDFINQLVQTDVVDFDMRPVDPSEGFDPYVMVALSAVSSFGTDRSGTVHFDYWTGSKNAAKARHVEDFSTICNKLYDYLGPKAGVERWAGNITPGSPGTTVDPTASRALYGEFMAIRIYDSLQTENSNRPLYIALWNAEQGLRIEPRNMLFVTPLDGEKALYVPPQDFDVGDLIEVNVGDALGITLADAQRVYGYDKTWTREDVAQVSELITSADAE
jgi:hypothetical protein